MKIQTNAGEVTLTAEMVCRGMVFAPKDPRDYVMGEGRVFVVGHRDEANGVWRDARDENLGTNVFGADRLLGCDPAIATRADCERYGVHGDAAAHGFARLRDGGAVDLLREGEPRGSMFRCPGGGPPISPRCSMGRYEMVRQGQWIGLNAVEARPEDMRRLCCGDHQTEEILDGYTGRTATGNVCSLAIGDHAEHEDLATGVKWSARPNPLEHLRGRAAVFVSQPAACPNCGSDDATCRGSLAGLKACAAKGGRHILRIDDGGTYVRGNENYRVGVDPAQPGTETTFVSVAMRKAGESLAALGEAAKHAAESAMPVPAAAAIKWEMGTASLGQSQAHILRDGDVYRWQVNHLGLRIREGVEPHAFDAHAAAGRILFAVHDATAGIEWLAGFFGLLFRIHDATPAAKRAKQEAPLVALVAAVPAGLDPIGWRAAVLAVHECQSRYGSPIQGDHFAAWLMHSLREDMDDCDAGTPYAYGYHGYLRAIAPAAKVDRVRATWKTRGPVLPCDNGEDE